MIAKISAPVLMRAFAETEGRRGQIQGFYIESTGEHYVMDFALERGQQQRWTQYAPSEKYDEMHVLKMEEIERLGMQVICEWLTENSPVTTADI